MALFRDHETALLKKYDLLTSEDVDAEYDVINNKRKQNDVNVDEITFFCYLKSRISAVVSKTPPFDDRVDTIFKGRFKLEENRVPAWTYEDCAIYKNRLVVGQPNGWISLINLDSKTLVTEFQAYAPTHAFRWTDIAMNSSVIACSAGNTTGTKLYFHNGELACKCPLPAGRLILDEEKLILGLSGG